MTYGVLVAVASTVALACLLAIVLVVATKVRRTVRQRRRAALLRPFRSQLIVVSAGEDEGRAALSALVAADGAAGRVVDAAAVGMLGKVRGMPADQLVEVLQVHGAVRDATSDLRHRSPVRRARAAQLLGLTRARITAPALVTALRDDAVEVRAGAAYALGLMGDADAAGPLLEAVDAPDAGLPAGIAAQALLSMGVGISQALLDGLYSERAGTRHLAAYVSGVGSFTRSVPALRRLLENDVDLTVREASATALAAIGTALDVGVLGRHTVPGLPLSLRRTCAIALGELGDVAAVPLLTELLDDPDPRLAELAARALVELGPAGQSALLERPVSEPDAPHGAIEAALTIARLQGALR
jgi:hypothetical protein